MNKVRLSVPTHQVAFPKTIMLLGVLLGFWVSPSMAGQQSAQFGVTINLQTNNTPINSGLCRSSTGIGTFGAALTVVCTTGEFSTYAGNPANLPWATLQNNPYRLVTYVSSAGETLGVIDSYTGGGTITSWRVIKLSNLDYLEMLIHW